MNNDLEVAISFLLDKYADEGGRDDIAMDFAEYDNLKVFDALLFIVQDNTDSEIVRDSCIESLAYILHRNKRNKLFIENIGIVRIQNALSLIHKIRADLYIEFELNDFC